MPNGFYTPELIMEVVEAGEDAVITIKEFNDIMGVITSIFLGVMFAIFVGMLMREITKETGIKTKEVGGVIIPVYSY